jgi:hypothetical protein
MGLNFFKRFKIDFAIVGAQKSGTTALYSFLDQHPSIAFGKEKELHYFDNDSFFYKDNSEISRIKLNKQFKRGVRGKLKGDATPIYMYWDNSIERIAKHNKDIKIIVVLRDPVERAFSHWKMEYHKGNDKEIFSVAIRKEEERLNGNKHRNFSYKSRGLYSLQLERIYKCFPKKNVIILFNDDLKNRHDKTLQSIFDFLDLKQINVSKENVQPSSMRSFKSDLTMSSNDKKFLEDFFKSEKEVLQNIYKISF